MEVGEKHGCGGYFRHGLRRYFCRRAPPTEVMLKTSTIPSSRWHSSGHLPNSHQQAPEGTGGQCVPSCWVRSSLHRAWPGPGWGWAALWGDTGLGRWPRVSGTRPKRAKNGAVLLQFVLCSVYMLLKLNWYKFKLEFRLLFKCNWCGNQKENSYRRYTKEKDKEI